MSFAYAATITVDHTKVPSTQTNFPVLVSLTDATLKTVGNGGQVQNANGYDIRFFSDSGLSVALDFELESYGASTGVIVFWVRIASLSSASDTVIYAGYGDAALNTNASSTSTWNSNFKAVYHLKEATGSNPADSTANAFNLTQTSSPTQTTGKVDGALDFNAGSGQIAKQTAAATIVNPAADHTLLTWLNNDSFTPPDITQRAISIMDLSNNALMLLNGDGSANVFTYTVYTGGGTENTKVTASTFSTGTWYRLACTFTASGTVIGISVNGSSQSVNVGGGFGAGIAENKIYLGSRSGGSGQYDGRLDEVQLLNTVLSADWITTDYNNQSSPSTFLSATYAAAGGGDTLFAQSIF